jgi:hypothetical protein
MDALWEIVTYPHSFAYDFFACPYYRLKNVSRSLYIISASALYMRGYSIPVSLITPYLMLEILVRAGLFWYYVLLLTIR